MKIYFNGLDLIVIGLCMLGIIICLIAYGIDRLRNHRHEKRHQNR